MIPIKLNNAVVRAIDILQLLAKSSKALTLTEISNSIDAPKSSVLDILYTLVEREFVELDNEDFKTYRLGTVMFELGVSAVNRGDLQSITQPLLNAFAEKTGKTVFLAIPKGNQVVYINRIDGSGPVQSACAIGSTNPMHLTGIGKAIMAGKSDEEIHAMMGDGPYEVRTPNSIGDYPTLIKEMQAIRSQGYSIDNGEGVEQLYCFGAPIYDYTNQIIAAISVTMLNWGRTRASDTLALESLLETSMLISRKLGFTKDQFYR